MSTNSRTDSGSVTTSLTLAQRFSRQQRAPPGYSHTELQSLPMAEFGKMKINFGKVNKGRCYEDVVLSDPGWVKWCADHLSSSPKDEHKAFLLYVSRATAEVEELERQLLQNEEDSPIVIPLTSAPGGQATGSSADHRVEELQADVAALQQRVMNLEVALEQVMRMQH